MKRYFLTLIFLIVLFPSVVAAIDLQIPIPTPEELVYEVSDLTEYIRYFYQFFVTSAGVLSTVMIVFGGFRWLTAAGNAQRIGEAKETITSAIFGLVLALVSYVLLYTINPSIVSLEKLTIPIIKSQGPSANLVDFTMEGIEFSGQESKPSCVQECVDGLKLAVNWLSINTIPKKNLKIISGSRSIEFQRELYKKNCPTGPESCDTVTCNPDTSQGCPHVRGVAVDLAHQDNYIDPDFVCAMKAAGFCQLLGANEVWHFEKPKASSACVTPVGGCT